MIKRIVEYIHRPNKTEVGVGTNTNDSYLKLSPSIEDSEIFQQNEEEYFLEPQSGDRVLFKAVKYQTGGKEYRLTKLGAVRMQYDIECGDELIFRREIGTLKKQPIFEIHKFPKVMFYYASKGNYQIAYPERFSNWKPDGDTIIDVLYHGQRMPLMIKFKESKSKRADSPDLTTFYTLELNGNVLQSQTFCLSFENECPTLREYNKWEYNEITID